MVLSGTSHATTVPEGKMKTSPVVGGDCSVR